MTRLLTLGLLVGVPALVTGQATAGRPPLESRLDAQTLALLRPIFEAARADSIPLTVIEAKALEGTAKGVPAPRIHLAVERLAAQLMEARHALREALPRATLSDAEIVAGSDALSRGVAAHEITALRRHLPPPGSVVVPLAVLGDLVHQGIPADHARSVIERLLDAGVTQEHLAQIPALVNVALRVGAPPLLALESALPFPLRPVPPQRAPIERPRPPSSNPEP